MAAASEWPTGNAGLFANVDIEPAYSAMLLFKKIGAATPAWRAIVMKRLAVLSLSLLLATGSIALAQGAGGGGGGSGGGASGGSAGASSGSGTGGGSSMGASGTSAGALSGTAGSVNGTGSNAMPNTSNALSQGTTGNAMGGITTNPSNDPGGANSTANSATRGPTPSNNSIQPNNSRR